MTRQFQSFHYDSFGTSFPLELGHVRGLRAWEVTVEGQLVPIFHKQLPWGITYDAICDPLPFMRPTMPSVGMPVLEDPVPEPEPHGPVPDPNCDCGIYGYFDETKTYRTPHRVTGIIQGTGRTIHGTRGFKTARAQILALYLPPIRVLTVKGSPDPATVIAATPPGLARVWHYPRPRGLVSGSPDLTPGVCDGDLVPEEKRALLRERYAAVPFFEDYRAMLAAYPIDPIEPVPTREA